MSKIKYSIIIPTLNGYEGLKVIIPYILKIDRQDIEIILSINNSIDKSLEFVKSINDKRLKFFIPSKKLPHSTNLNFAYSKSSGEWLGHLGDDDLILNNRFDTLDKYTDNFDMIVGKSAHYNWKNLDPALGVPNSTKKNDLIYTQVAVEKSGVEFYKEYLNTFGVPAGGQWLVKKEVYEKVKKTFGFFSPDAANVEFFSFRASAKFSKNILVLDYPLMIAGTMNKSSSTISHKADKNKWDWNFENPGWFDCAKVNCANYQTVSYDALLRVISKFPNDFKLIDKKYWAKIFLGHFLFWYPGSNIKNNKCNRTIYLIWIIKNFHFYILYEIMVAIKKKISSFNLSKTSQINDTIFLATKGINEITEFADYLEKELKK